MAHDVFISYSSKDKNIADAVTTTLENRMVRCWIAPRDVPPGQPYAASLVNAIESSKVFILILSSDSNQSPHVLREVSEAVENGISIIPFRIEKVDLSQEMRFYIKSLHWLDAMSEPMKKHYDDLCESVIAITGKKQDSGTEIITKKIEQSVPKIQPEKKRNKLILPVLLGGLAIVTAIVFFTMNQAPKNPIQNAEPSLTFSNFNSTLWEMNANNSFTSIDQNAITAILWSDEIIEGDLLLSFYVTVLKPGVEEPGYAFIIFYGDGNTNSEGSLTVAAGEEWLMIINNDPYDKLGSIFPTNTPAKFSQLEINRPYLFRIDIISNELTVNIDGKKVRSATLPPDVVKRGKIGFVKYFLSPSLTYSNIKIEKP